MNSTVASTNSVTNTTPTPVIPGIQQVEGSIPTNNSPSGTMVHLEANEAPTLKSTDTLDIINFTEKYKLYVLRMEDARRAGGSHYMATRLVRTMIDPQLPQIIAQWHLQVNNINDFLKFLDDHVKKDKSSHCRVHEIFREELKMDLNLKSPYARTT